MLVSTISELVCRAMALFGSEQSGRRCPLTGLGRHQQHAGRSPKMTLAVWKRISSKCDENDVLQFDLKVECDCELVA